MRETREIRALAIAATEALCKVLAHNICCIISAIHELGVEPAFGELAEVSPACG